MVGQPKILDKYIFRQTIGAMGGVIGVVMSLMVLEHLPRLLEITRLSGHRGYIITRMVIGLLPEYVGIGLLVGLYLAIALTVRRLAMRGELDVIEACGIGPRRWMRIPILLAFVVSAVTLLNQGWLMPAGERQLDEIGRRMAVGEFGYNLSAGEFVDLGSGNALSFEKVDRKTHHLIGLFLKTKDQTFTANSGRLSMFPTGAVIELFDGQAVGAQDGSVLNFDRLRYLIGKPGVQPGDSQEGVDPLRLAPLDTLVGSPLASDRSVAWGRALWAALALFLPAIAFVLGKPPRREAGAVGIIAGTALLVVFLKTTATLTHGQSLHPEMLSAEILLGWTVTTFALIKAEKALGQGFLDHWASRLARRTGPFWRSRRKLPSISTSSRRHAPAPVDPIPAVDKPKTTPSFRSRLREPMPAVGEGRT